MGLIVFSLLVCLAIAALLIIPRFVDVQQYKAQIEERVSKAIGCPLTLGGDLRLSLFPWAQIHLADFCIENPPGFDEKYFLTIRHVEIQMASLSLLSNNIRIQSIELKEPRLFLIKNMDGKGNWEGIGRPSDLSESPKKGEKTGQEEVRKREEIENRLGIAALAASSLSATGGSIWWIDHTNGNRNEIKDLRLNARDLSFDHPIRVKLSALVDDRPFSSEGEVGPIGKDPWKRPIPLDITVTALKEVKVRLKGKIRSLAAKRGFDLAVRVSPFSPRKLVEAMGQALPLNTALADALTKVALSASLKGGTGDISISDGILDIDKSRLTFSLKAKDFFKPDIDFDLKADQIDLDEYLSIAGKRIRGKEEKGGSVSMAKGNGSDYTALRNIVLQGTVRVGKIKVKGARIQDLRLEISGKEGLFSLHPIDLKLYDGEVTGKCSLDVRKDIPRTMIELKAKGIKASPMLKDVMGKDLLEGTLATEISLRMDGNKPNVIRDTLSGTGDFLISDGAIIGIDLDKMIHDVRAAFGVRKGGARRPKTDFGKFHIPFAISKGIASTKDTTLKSSLLSVTAAGKADLVKKTLDFRVIPEFVPTLKAQRASKNGNGLTVPVLVSGTFSSPKFRVDLKAMLRKALQGKDQ